MSLPTNSLDDAERLRRAEYVHEALATLRLEGLEPSAEAKSLAQQYVDGALSLAQLGHVIRRLHDRSLHLPRHKRSEKPGKLSGS